MKTNVYNLKKEVVGQIDLDEKIFNYKWNPDLVQQILVSQQSNSREKGAHVKTRGEVRGGGKKPWKQKHTGRARHGSIRSPLWKGGGVTHGPDPARNYIKKINKKMLRAGIYSILSKKLSLDEIRIIDSLKINSHKTKELNLSLKNFFNKSVNSLIIPASDNKLIFRAASNIPKTKCLDANSLNVVDLLSFKNVLIDREAIKNIK